MKVSYPLILEQRFAWNTRNNTGNIRTPHREKFYQSIEEKPVKLKTFGKQARGIPRCTTAQLQDMESWNYTVLDLGKPSKAIKPNLQPSTARATTAPCPQGSIQGTTTLSAERDQSENYREKWKGWIQIVLPP
ncbi:hypothetical protein DUI87_24702 [Hirundo rustica rustica]|uniref:Uncharacterized protein n=1 Tax=Hirundo rustica rustica TaxID=333673 RepID=A0A3M0JCB8_HIRRU|nr:hypothetical protein DUI87_24702 [Hirundo rustica rustica]